jgi:hypothetical protein
MEPSTARGNTAIPDRKVFERRKTNGMTRMSFPIDGGVQDSFSGFSSDFVGGEGRGGLGVVASVKECHILVSMETVDREDQAFDLLADVMVEIPDLTFGINGLSKSKVARRYGQAAGAKLQPPELE